MSVTLKERIISDMKDAMRSKEKVRLGTIRLITAAIKQREVDERIELDDQQILVVLDKMLKQRRDSINQYSQAGREDLAAVEAKEIEVVQEYMPSALSEDEVTQIINDAIAATGATSMKEMGKVMGAIKAKLQGRADMGEVSSKIKALLNG
jgi:hypothetical protein